MLHDWIPDEDLVIGKCLIKVCDGDTCHARRSKHILAKFRSELGLPENRQTTDDMIFTVVPVPCAGDCAVGPVCYINDVLYENMNVDKAIGIAAELKKEYSA